MNNSSKGRLGPDRVVVQEARFTEQQLREFQRRVTADASNLSEEGIFVALPPCCRPEPDGLAVDYFAADQKRAEQLLGDRYGAFVSVRYQGASRYALSPRPFGSWLAQGDMLYVFYALPLNGERPGDCTVAELEDSVIVGLTILDRRGAKTLVGGFTPSQATVTLRSPLGTRAVIDGSENRARPHWTAVASIKLPLLTSSGPLIRTKSAAAEAAGGCERGSLRELGEVFVEEHAGDEFLARGHFGLLEQALDVVLDGVGESTSLVAISGLVRPWASRVAISRSRGVTPYASRRIAVDCGLGVRSSTIATLPADAAVG